ncbi:hypothetical protein H257_02070 [Aphanomyces astaci]|uniref:Uncharacterized protein n=1 Tax=Aphanomyces astaci TaxID=112090 RepID=W4H707_APHAT|nr:hypothetical protein H257_02070 [Aphanomyces astaci]ETV87064.1 hypothetical protein H257_02070 [Aphanomyces astaci]|eukprot:XP_009823863.1 hypothetical protein H257_02070 [Aphanomyces astaci]
MDMFIPRGFAKHLLSLSRAEMRSRIGAVDHWTSCSSRVEAWQQVHHVFQVLPPTVLRRKHHCRRCGSSMCSPCTVLLRCVDRPTNSRTNDATAAGKVLQVVLGAGQGGHDTTQGGSEWRQSIETNSAVTSDTAHPVAYLVSPTRNGDYFFVTNMHRSVPNTRTSYLTVSYALSPKLDSTPSNSQILYAPEISMLSTDFSEYNLTSPLQDHSPRQWSPPSKPHQSDHLSQVPSQSPVERDQSRS